MIDREKVIKGLEGIYQCISPVNHSCGDCPYQDNHVECRRRALSDALALLKDDETQLQYRDDHIAMYQAEIKRLEAMLKEQKPRILDWDEIKNYPVVYGEFRGIKEIYPLIITVDDWGRCLSWNPGINVTKEFLFVVSDEEDRRNTRCWNHMPTEEQRQAVPWDEQE